MLSSPAGIAAIDPFSRFDVAPRRAVIAAVSGGSDSTALLLLLKAHLERHELPPRLIAVTVDHRLRQHSGLEAQSVASLCRSLGVEHHAVAWDGPKPAAGLPAAARLARYGLLARTAQAVGTDLVFTGHTADDQAETVLMRQARGVGRGLAGMAPATLFRGRTWILRPLLATRRQALRDELTRRSTGWTDDPTNRDATFERPRLRAGLSGSNDQLVEEAARLASQAAASRAELGGRAAKLLAGAVTSVEAGGVRLLPALTTSGAPEAALYAFRIVLAVVGDCDQLPDEQRAGNLWQRLKEGSHKAALSRCVVETSGNDIAIRRDLRGHFGPAPALRLAPWADFLPCFDMAPARAVAELIGAAAPPPPPFTAPCTAPSPWHSFGADLDPSLGLTELAALAWHRQRPSLC